MYEEEAKNRSKAEFELKDKFSEEFFDEFQYDAEFRAIFFSMIGGESPYKMIEHLCVSKKKTMEKLHEAIEKAPIRFIIESPLLNPSKI